MHQIIPRAENVDLEVEGLAQGDFDIREIRCQDLAFEVLEVVMGLVCTDDNVVLRTGRFFHGVDRFGDDVLADVEFVVVRSSRFFALYGRPHLQFYHLLHRVSTSSGLPSCSLSA